MHLSLYRDHRRKNISLKQVSIQVSMLGDCFYNHWVVSRQCVKHSLELLCFPPAALQLYWRYWGSEEKRYRKLCLFCSASNSELNPAGSKEFSASCVKATQTAIQWTKYSCCYCVAGVNFTLWACLCFCVLWCHYIPGDTCSGNLLKGFFFVPWLSVYMYFYSEQTIFYVIAKYSLQACSSDLNQEQVWR